MPASAWLALGTVLAALVAPSAGSALTALVAGSLAAAGWGLAGRTGRRTLLAIAIGAGALAARLLIAPAPPPEAAAPPQGSGPWTARVESVAAPRAGQQVATLRLETDATVALAATLPRFPAVEPGDRVHAAGAIQAPPSGPYGDYLRRTGIAGTIRLRSLELLPTADAPAATLERLRRHAAAALAAAIAEPEAGLASGIVIGLRDRVDRELAADFTTVGASHVVAISGWNIAIVAATIAALCGHLSRRRRAVVTAAAIVAYVAFAGASASVVRAAAMAGVVLLARESGRSGRAAAALGWAAVVLLIVDPRLVADAGFQLSALATAGILAWATPFSAWLAAHASRLPRWLTECLAVSLVAQAATLPVVLLSFGRLAIVSPIVNLGVVPLVAPAMAASAVALAGGLATLAGAPAIVATLLGLPAWFLLSVVVGIVQASAALPFASATLEPPWNVVGAGAATAGVAALAAARRVDVVTRWRRRSPRSPPTPTRAPAPAPARQVVRTAPTGSRAASRVVATVLIAATAGVVVVGARRPDGTTRITVLDVGQGDAILVQGSHGGRLLVDGGPDPDRLLVELDRRLPPWDRRLDVVVLTHPHEDHVAGLALLLERYRVGRVFEPGMRGAGPGYAAWERALSRDGAPARGTLGTGDVVAVDDLWLRVLWPDRGCVPREPPESGREINDRSIVLLGEIRGRRVLLTGDLEDDVDPILVDRGLPRIDLLKVAHHGSRTASSPALLDAIRPRLAVVSAGVGNTYGHPAAAALGRLQARGALIARTDTEGSIEVSFGAGGMFYAASGPRSAAGTPRPSPRAGAQSSPEEDEQPVRRFDCAIPSP
jgi:competence protein ComEC